MVNLENLEVHSTDSLLYADDMFTKIILSGLRNTGKTSVFWALQQQLAWPTFSVSQFLRDYIRTHGLQGSSNQVMAEHEQQMRQSINQRLAGLMRLPDRCIIEARIWEDVRLESPGCLKVLLTADESVRVERNAFRESIGLERSRSKLINKENKWLDKVTAQFGFDDFFAHNYYDLVIDTGPLSIDQVVRVIIEKLEQKAPETPQHVPY